MPNSFKSSDREFSHVSRGQAIERFKQDRFDFLIVGGGITGAAVARDAARRGLRVALVDKHDFAFGTSSRSSKLIHGGLRYLENFELALVFEALSERSLLLKTAPHMVRPLPFFWPVYDTDAKGMGLLSAGLWLYDLLSLFRTPGWHRRLNRQQILKELPQLSAEGLRGGFKYFDASMWDDAMVPEILRSAKEAGAFCANYVEAISPLWDKSSKRIVGFKVRDTLAEDSREVSSTFDLRAEQVIICAGPWTDQVGELLSPDWSPHLLPSRGVHLVFDAKRFSVPGAMVMSHPKDGRISFVIPRPDFGAGVTIVGTTDGPSPKNPEDVSGEDSDQAYLFELLARYFPRLRLGREDLVSTYVGVRPLVKPGQTGVSLQKVSREHHIDLGPGQVVWVAGGKYTTHRKMAEEIVEFSLKHAGALNLASGNWTPAHTEAPMNPNGTKARTDLARSAADARGLTVPEKLWDRYGAEALEIMEIEAVHPGSLIAEGFPCLESQLRFGIRRLMVMRLEDFYFRRQSLFLAVKDHGLSWADQLGQVWGEELHQSDAQVKAEIAHLKGTIQRRAKTG